MIKHGEFLVIPTYDFDFRVDSEEETPRVNKNGKSVVYRNRIFFASNKSFIIKM